MHTMHGSEERMSRGDVVTNGLNEEQIPERIELKAKSYIMTQGMRIEATSIESGARSSPDSKRGTNDCDQNEMPPNRRQRTFARQRIKSRQVVTSSSFDGNDSGSRCGEVGKVGRSSSVDTISLLKPDIYLQREVDALRGMLPGASEAPLDKAHLDQ